MSSTSSPLGEQALCAYLAQCPPAALAFSGGCDSALLLALAAKAGCSIRPYFVKGDFQPEFELEDARRLCRELGVPLTVIQAHPLTEPCIRANDAQRCYHCKRLIFENLISRAKADGRTLLFDGTNASDPEADRPGMRALRELSVQSPLRRFGLTKTQVRAISRRMGLFTADKPAYACLATRIPTGTPLEKRDLERVESAEAALFGMGFSNLRLRLSGDTGRLQLPAAQLEKAAAQHEAITRQLRPFVSEVLLDLTPRPEVE